MAFEIKPDQNTPVEDVNTITNPNTKSMVDRYVWASNFCKGKKVLDCASGHCYGGVILKALGANRVTFGDIDNDALERAHERLSDFSYDFWQDCDVTKDWSKQITNPDLFSFGVIVSIETFEHVPREGVPQMLKNFKQICEPGGKIIISTPQRQTPRFEYQEGSTHLYEYTLNEFIQEISDVFDTFEIYFAIEFKHPASKELNTVFTKNAEFSKQAAVMIAVIQNE